METLLGVLIVFVGVLTLISYRVYVMVFAHQDELEVLNSKLNHCYERVFADYRPKYDQQVEGCESETE